MSNKKYFPIKTATACLAKWSFSKVLLHLEETSSCHRVIQHNFDLETFNFHNTSEKIQERKIMLDGYWPDGDPNSQFETTCKKYCGKFEQNNGKSDRHFYNSIPNLYPDELDNDPTLTEIDPTILEVYINNTCNLKCVYCLPELSSNIDYEMKKHGRFEKHGLVLETKHKPLENFDKIQDKFWWWMESKAYKLKRLHLLGGEPFYQKQFDDFLNFFNDYPCPSLEFNIVTNLMISKEKLKEYIERIKNLIIEKKIRRLDITASIDCWGPQQEFVRHGIKLSKWEENFEYLISERWIKLNINSTVSVLTIKTLPELLCKLKKWTKNRKIEHYFSQLYYPSYMAPDILGAKEFQEDFKCILSFIETQSWRGAQAKEHFEGLVNNVNAGRFNSKEVLKLLTYLDELDRRRNTNWRELFSWLIKYEDLCGIQE